MSKPRQLLLSLLAAFILLAIWVSKYPVNHLDIGISHFIQQFHGPALDKIMIAISAFGDMPVALYCMAGTAFLFFIFKFKREALFILSISFSGIITFALKHLFSRPRPTSEYVRLIEHYRNHSFPSGHTLSYVAFFGFIIFLMQQLKSIPPYLRIGISTLAYIIVITGPISRIYLGAHWFTDIVGGLLIGLSYLLCVIFYYKKSSASQ